MITLRGLTCWFPGSRIATKDLSEAQTLEAAEREVFDQLGIETVVDAAGASGVELAIEASERALEAAGIAGEDLAGVILCQSRSPEFLMSSEATRLQQAVGADEAFVFGLTDMGCVGISAAIQLARSMLLADASGGAVLVASGSRPFGTRRFRHPVTITGDGGSALVVCRDGEGPKLLDVACESNGRYWDLYRIDYRGNPVEEWVERCRDPRAYAFELAVESRNRFRRLNRERLERLGLEEVQHFAMQNLSSTAFDFYERNLGMRFAEACRWNLRGYGHLGSGDVVANLARGIETGEFAAGERVLVMNNSPVAAWSSMVVEV